MTADAETTDAETVADEAGDAAPRVHVCFVCLGNICRSPTAEGVLRRLLVDEGLDDRVLVDSAGTGGWHVGAPPDDRATAEAARRGVDLSTQRARRLHPGDLEAFDLVLTMDASNQADVLDLATTADQRDRVRPLRSFDPTTPTDADWRTGELDVPDPYYGDDGFALVFDLVDAACRGLVEHLRAEHLDGPGTPGPDGATDR